MGQTVAQIKAMLADVDEAGFDVLERSLRADTRKGVQTALKQARSRLEAQRTERERVAGMYAFEARLTDGRVAVGLDEVGRGPLAGPLTIGAVVLDPEAGQIKGVNDSKQLTPAERERISAEVKRCARAWTTVSIPPERIDESGMSACLREAFARAVAQIESQGVQVDVVLLDGNPLGFDPREKNVIKGDAKCPSIAAASVIAKVERDAYMVELDGLFPGYDFAASKGYGSARHRQAIQTLGLTPHHRESFCQNILQVQESLF